MMVVLEVCIDSIISAVNASESGAVRLELCSALSEGGLTPSVGLFLGVKRAISKKTRIFCMIRIRRGNFVYSDEEIDAMVDDVKYFRNAGADGIVFGCLTDEGEIHSDHCRRLINAWGSDRPITFHRAFDETRKEDYKKNIDALKGLGFLRVLTSGYESSAELGLSNLKNIVKYAKEVGMTVMPGAGINEFNAAEIIRETGCDEIHASARSAAKSSTNQLSMGGGSEDLQPLLICDRDKVKRLLELSKSIAL